MSSTPLTYVNQDGYLTTQVKLDCWKGFLSYTGLHFPKGNESDFSDGDVDILVFTSEDNPNFPADHQEKAIQYAIEHQEEIHHQLLIQLLNEFPSIAENYDFLDIRDNKLPIVSNTEQFKRLIRLSVLYIKKEQKDGYAYVCYGFGCVWDGEHGLGIMTHKDRVIEIGGTDSAFAWVKDLEASE